MGSSYVAYSKYLYTRNNQWDWLQILVDGLNMKLADLIVKIGHALLNLRCALPVIN